MGSIARQSVPCARVIIACHETPLIATPAGLNVEFAPVGFDIPPLGENSHADANRKRTAAAARHRTHGGGLLYLLDADDLLDRSFIETVTGSTARAMVLKNGYQYDEARNQVMTLPYFWRRCGSCGVVDWAPEDLPQAETAGDDCRFVRFLHGRHFNWDRVLRDWGWEMEFISRRIAMYVVGHGQNISLAELHMPRRWQLYNAVFPRSRPSLDLRARFGLDG